MKWYQNGKKVTDVDVIKMMRDTTLVDILKVFEDTWAIKIGESITINEMVSGSYPEGRYVVNTEELIEILKKVSYTSGGGVDEVS